MTKSNYLPIHAAPCQIGLGGTGHPLPVRWRQSAPGGWSVVPDPKLPKSTRDDFGPIIGEVSYNARAGSCDSVIRSRHGRSRSFSAQASSAEAARTVLVKEIANITFNPMWVEGFDTVLGPSDDLSPATGTPPSDPYDREWGDRLGEEINLHHAPSRSATGRALDLSARLGQLADNLRDGEISHTTPEGARVWRLFAWGHGLLDDAFDQPLDPTSGLTPAERADVLMVMAKLIVAGRLTSLGSKRRATSSQGVKAPTNAPAATQRLAGVGRP